MSRVDLRQLSSRDFEDLARDLLQAEWNVTLEAFKAGPDQGMDLRHISPEGRTTIVQSKHYAVSGFDNLAAHLRRSEVAKVQRLRPDRYVLVTSVGLSPQNKASLKSLFDPFVLREDDIKGAQDIESLLQRHPTVERAHFKLWLTSTAVLERVLHNAETCQTEFEVQRIVRKLPLFVQTGALLRAQRILDEHQIVVISGAPGIGKTTLAEILLYSHMEQGYEPVVIRASIDEGKKLFSTLRPQIFYFDDFLGQTFLGEGRFPGGANSDRALVDFMEMVRATGHSRFILTTREHLLQSAQLESERLQHAALPNYRYLLTLSDYSKAQRARILYNHLYFSELPTQYKEQILADDFFLEVIAHGHFNPRLIEWLSSATQVRRVPSSSYREHVRDMLANPRAIWSHAFNKQISTAARNVLLVLYSVDGEFWLSDLKPVWEAFNSFTAAKYGRSVDPREYQTALSELDNAFICYDKGAARFLDPSVREMVGAEIIRCPEYALDLVSSATRFGQLPILFDLRRRSRAEEIAKIFTGDDAPIVASMTRLLRAPEVDWQVNEAGQRWGRQIDMPVEYRLLHVATIAVASNSSELRALFEKETRALASQYRTSRPFSNETTALISALPQLDSCGPALQRELVDALFTHSQRWGAGQLGHMLECSRTLVDRRADDSARLAAALENYRDSGVFKELQSCRTLGEHDDLLNELIFLEQVSGADFSLAIGWLKSILSQNPPPERDERSAAEDSPLDGLDDSDEAIRNVFKTLID